MSESAIEWTDATWNPVTGCSKVSPGCAHCYAEALTMRHAKNWGVPRLPWTPENAEQNVVLHPERLDQPSRWRKPRMVFVNSMSDLFHEQVPDEFIRRIFDVMRWNDQHTFQVLTKRPERMRDFIRSTYVGLDDPPPHIWLGTSIENRRYVGRADHLRATPAAVRFISAEPLLGPLEGLSLRGIDWLIVGGESGPQHRPMRAEWVYDLQHAAEDAGTAFFFKQWGGRTPKAGGRLLDGREWDEMPRRSLAAA